MFYGGLNNGDFIEWFEQRTRGRRFSKREADVIIDILLESMYPEEADYFMDRLIRSWTHRMEHESSMRNRLSQHEWEKQEIHNMQMLQILREMKTSKLNTEACKIVKKKIIKEEKRDFLTEDDYKIE